MPVQLPMELSVQIPSVFLDADIDRLVRLIIVGQKVVVRGSEAGLIDALIARVAERVLVSENLSCDELAQALSNICSDPGVDFHQPGTNACVADICMTVLFSERKASTD